MSRRRGYPALPVRAAYSKAVSEKVERRKPSRAVMPRMPKYVVSWDLRLQVSVESKDRLRRCLQLANAFRVHSIRTRAAEVYDFLPLHDFGLYERCEFVE